jgi:hypothetical protein
MVHGQGAENADLRIRQSGGRQRRHRPVLCRQGPARAGIGAERRVEPLPIILARATRNHAAHPHRAIDRLHLARDRRDERCGANAGADADLCAPIIRERIKAVEAKARETAGLIAYLEAKLAWLEGGRRDPEPVL